MSASISSLIVRTPEDEPDFSVLPELEDIPQAQALSALQSPQALSALQLPRTGVVAAAEDAGCSESEIQLFIFTKSNNPQAIRELLAESGYERELAPPRQTELDIDAVSDNDWTCLQIGACRTV